MSRFRDNSELAHRSPNVSSDLNDEILKMVQTRDFLPLLLVVSFPATVMVANDKIDVSQAVREIERLGDIVIRDDNQSNHPVIRIDLVRNDKFSDQFIPLLKPLTSLNRLRQSYSD